MSTEKIEVKELEVVDFSDIKFETKTEGTTATMKCDNEKYYQEKAAEVGIDKKTLETVSKFDEAFLSAVADTVRDAQERTFVADKELKKVIATVPYGLSKSQLIKMTTERARVYPIPNTDDGTGKPKTVTKPKVTIEVIKPAAKLGKTRIKAIEAALKDKIINS